MAIFLIFGQFWLFFGQKGPKIPKSKNVFFCSIFFCWEEASTHQISESFTKRFGFCQFSSFLVNFGYFWLKNGQKRPKSKKSFFIEFPFCWEASTYQISENFPKRFWFSNFSSFLVDFGCFLAKRGKKKPKSKSGSVVKFY